MTAERTPISPSTSVRGELLLSLYLDRTRVRAARLLAENTAPHVMLDTLLDLGHAGDRRFTQNAEVRRQLKSDFRKRIMERDRSWAGEDIHPSLDGLLSETATLPGWFGELCDCFDLSIYFERDEPRVDRRCLLHWHRLTSRLDGDALLCFLLAKRGFTHEIPAMGRWGLVTRISDRDLDVLMRQGVSDLHLHLGGLRSARLAWLALLDGELAVEELRTYLRARDSGGELLSDVADNVSFERSCITDLVDGLAAASTPDQLSFSGVAELGPYRDRGLPASGQDSLGLAILERRLLRERLMMASAFQHLIEARRDEDSIRTRRLEHALDQYIVVKSWFLSRHTQGVETNPGLQHFRSFFSSAKRWRAHGTPARVSPRIQAVRHDVPSLFAVEPGRNLKRIELRLGPLGTSAEYVIFLKRWERIERELGIDRSRVDIRFNVHFKRSLETPRGSGSRHITIDPGPADWLTKGWSRPKLEDSLDGSPFATWLREFDRDTAALHVLRTQAPPHLRRLVARIARIDFAGQERDVRIDWAAFNLNLMRGDPSSQAKLEKFAEDNQNAKEPHPYHSCWEQLAGGENRAGPSLEALKLGLTCHAGEDFAHPLEGLFGIVNAVERLNMTAGDSIGHGLAIGVPMERYHSASNPTVQTSTGNLFDALVWLHLEITKNGAQHFGSESRVLEMKLWEWAQKIYDQPLPPSLMLFERLFKLRSEPVPLRDPDASAGDVISQLRWSEYWDRRTRRKRAELRPPPVLLDSLTAATTWAQSRVLELLASRGIVLEFNPSSNWRVSRAISAPEDVPYISILNKMKSLVLATLNTDNPGVFSTRIENEYAIAMDGLLNPGNSGTAMSRSEVLSVLERLRLTGLEHVYWPANGSESDKGSASAIHDPSVGYRWPGYAPSRHNREWTARGGTADDVTEL